MQNVILVIHILACIALTAVVLLQRSEGGALGIGGGGPGGGLMSGRGAAGALVRTTMIFAGVFFLTSLTLTTIAARGDNRSEGERLLEQESGVDGGPGVAIPDGRDPNQSLLESLGGGDALNETPLEDTSAEPESPAVDPSLNEVPLGEPEAVEPDVIEPEADPATGETAGETPDATEGEPQ